ncbi:MAG: homocysteine S-methyltransferase family protein [Dongiaceae bacterium]
MSAYRQALPQLAGGMFLTDGGLETTYIFHEGRDLPHFAIFDLLKDEAGTDWLRDYYRRYMAIARSGGSGFILESPTWRANPDWAAKLGYSAERLAEINRRSIDLLRGLRDESEDTDAPIVVSGCLGPRGDGYDPGRMMSADEAADYHAPQMRVFAASEADMASAMTLSYVNEGIGIVHAAKAAKMPVAISFTLETDGRLPTGQALQAAVEETDAATNGGAAYFMINCAHPTHFNSTLTGDGAWLRRLRGIRANASKRSHAELDQASDLDAGDPVELGSEYSALRQRLPWLNILGGCCGTDHRHVEAINRACAN